MGRPIPPCLQRAQRRSIASLQPDAPGEVENPTPPGVAMAVPFKYLPQPISGSPPSLAAIIHIHYPELTGELCTYLRNMPASTGIFISTNTPDERAEIAEALERWQVAASEIRVLPNRGRDIAPKLVGFADVHDCARLCTASAHQEEPPIS